MFRGKKYQDSAKQIDRGTLYESKDASSWCARPLPPSSTRPWSSM